MCAIARQIVAAEEGEAGQHGGAAAGEPFGQQRIDAALAGQRRIEAAVAGAAIAFFGNRQADDMRGRRSDGGDDSGAVARAGQDALHAADQAQRLSRARSVCQQIQAVLRIELVGDGGGAQ